MVKTRSGGGGGGALSVKQAALPSGGSARFSTSCACECHTALVIRCAHTTTSGGGVTPASAHRCRSHQMFSLSSLGSFFLSFFFFSSRCCLFLSGDALLHTASCLHSGQDKQCPCLTPKDISRTITFSATAPPPQSTPPSRHGRYRYNWMLPAVEMPTISRERE